MLNIYWYDKNLMLGKIKVGTVFYNAARSKSDSENVYKWNLVLPGKDRCGTSKTYDESMKACEDALHEWLRIASIENITD